MLAYVCGRLERRDAGAVAAGAGIAIGRASILAAASAARWDPSADAGATPMLRDWMVILEPERLGLSAALVELTLVDGAAQAEQHAAAAGVDGVVRVVSPLDDSRLFVEVLSEGDRMGEVKARLGELLIKRQRWHVLDRTTHDPALRTLRGILHRAAESEGLMHESGDTA